jgi:hypothetical protein
MDRRLQEITDRLPAWLKASSSIRPEGRAVVLYDDPLQVDLEIYFNIVCHTRKHDTKAAARGWALGVAEKDLDLAIRGAHHRLSKAVPAAQATIRAPSRSALSVYIREAFGGFQCTCKGTIDARIWIPTEPIQRLGPLPSPSSTDSILYGNER